MADEDVRPYGEEYVAEDWPHGLRCIDCDRLLKDGDRYASRITGMAEYAGESAFMTEVVCLECALRGGS